MVLSRREALKTGLFAAGVMSLGGKVLAQSVDPVWQAFQSAQADHSEALGFSSMPSQGVDGSARLIEGQMPEDLAGTLFRNGPGLFERNQWRYRHWFDGDGFIQRWRIENGQVHHRGRFVQTQKFQEEAQAGRFVRPAFGSTPPDDLGVSSTSDMNVANTSVLMAGGDLWALWEGGAPWALDPETLETKGEKNLGDGLSGVPFSAHPKRDPLTGDIWNFGQDPMGGRLVIWRLSAQGEAKSVQLLEDVPAGLIHDFMITDRHLVFVIGGPWFERIRLPFLSSFVAKPDQPMRAIRVSKDDFTDRQDWDLPPGAVFHFGGAWEDREGSITCDAAVYPDASFVLEGASAYMRGDFAREVTSHSVLSRIQLHRDGRVDLHRFEGCEFEFPQIDHRLTGQKRQFTWGVAQQDQVHTLSKSLARRDLQSGALDLIDMGPERIMEEPLFVPRADDEGAGYIVSTALNLSSKQTELLVFDALSLSQGPLAIWSLDYATSMGFHGTWQGSAA